MNSSSLQAMREPGGFGPDAEPRAPALQVDRDRSDQGSEAALTDATVMIVDDAVTTVKVLQAFLEDAGYRRFVATSASEQALALLHDQRPDVVLLDLNMPGVSGFDILTHMRSQETFRHTPVIVLTSSDDSATKLKCLQLGATDFLAKPVDSSELALRLRNTLAAKAYQDRLTYYDALTGLPNRRMFMERLEDVVHWARRQGGSSAVLLIDLDRFKQINDTLGHSAGDLMLQSVAQRLSSSLRPRDASSRGPEAAPSGCLARIGGDELTLVLAEIADTGDAVAVARDILASLEDPFRVQGQELFVTASIGIACFPDDGDDVESLIKHADVAMSHAKLRGRNRCEVYAEGINSKSRATLSLENELRRALERDELCLLYQPKVDVASGRVVGAEALLRWMHPERGIVSPLEFIPLAEETGLIVTIGEWALRTACEQSAAWQRSGLHRRSVAVNVSSQQFRDREVIRAVQHALERTRLDPSLLTVELTENAILDNARENIDALHALRAMGVKLSIDDFGTGYSSLSYLERFPVDELKIDRSFVNRIDADAGDAPIVSAIIAMAHSLGLRVVAEGVERREQLDFLARRGCEQYQGFLFSKPLAADEFLASALRAAVGES